MLPIDRNGSTNFWGTKLNIKMFNSSHYFNAKIVYSLLEFLAFYLNCFTVTKYNLLSNENTFSIKYVINI
jgi:hypothetical protein